jgi:hypothetical protein
LDRLVVELAGDGDRLAEKRDPLLRIHHEPVSHVPVDVRLSSAVAGLLERLGRQVEVEPGALGPAGSREGGCDVAEAFA